MLALWNRDTTVGVDYGFSLVSCWLAAGYYSWLDKNMYILNLQYSNYICTCVKSKMRKQEEIMYNQKQYSRFVV